MEDVLFLQSQGDDLNKNYNLEYLYNFLLTIIKVFSLPFRKRKVYGFGKWILYND